MAALAALLLRVAYHMVHYRECASILQRGTKQELMVLIVCFLLTVFVDMVMGVVVGIALVCVFDFIDGQGVKLSRETGIVFDA